MQFKTKLLIEDLDIGGDRAIDINVQVTCPGDGGDSFSHAFGVEKLPDLPDLTKMDVEVIQCVIYFDGSPAGLHDPTPREMKLIRKAVLRELEKSGNAVNWKIWN